MPYTGLALDMLFQPSWSENNSLYGNHYHEQLTSSTRLNLGMALEADLHLGETASMKLVGNVAYEHELSAARGVAANSLAAPGHDWQNEALSAPADKLKLDLGLDFKLHDAATLSIKGAHTAHRTGSSSSATISFSGGF